MTPAEFTAAAEQIAGPLWRSRLGPLLGLTRQTIYLYSTGELAVSERTRLQIEDKLALIE